MFAQSMVQQAVTSATRTGACADFEQLRLQGLRCQLWSRISGSRQALLNLYEVQKQVTVHTRNHAGVRLVPIQRIQGSEGRVGDFDKAFRPLKAQSLERWVSIALAHEAGVGLPVVELVQLNDVYFVRDGHHRISVARWLGQREIEAQVTVWHASETNVAPSRQTSRAPGTWVKRRVLTPTHAWLTTVGKRLITSGKQPQGLAQVELNKPALQGN